MVSIFYQNFYDSELHMQITLSLRGDWWLNLVIGFDGIVFWPVAPLYYLHWPNTLVSRAAHSKFNISLILLPFATVVDYEKEVPGCKTPSHLGHSFKGCILSLPFPLWLSLPPLCYEMNCFCSPHPANHDILLHPAWAQKQWSQLIAAWSREPHKFVLTYIAFSGILWPRQK